MGIKRYKVYWSIWYFGEGVQKPIANMQGWVKGLTTFVAGTAYFTDNADSAVLVGVCGLVIDAILSCVILEEKTI